MAKKVRKSTTSTTIRRTRSMEKCVEDAQDFLKPKGKKINKTKTMLRTLAESGVHPSKPAPKSARVARKPRASRPSKPAVPSLPAVLPPVPVPASSILPVRTTSSLSRSKAASKAVVPSKAHIFKSSSKDLPMPAFGFIDVCFCLDATGSMCSELAQVQSTITSLIEKIENKVKAEGITLRFAVVAYRDHGDANIIEAQDFTDAHDTIPFVNKLVANGGGDEPEAAHDGLLHACTKLNWVDLSGTPMLRYIFHVLDAPPHGKEFGCGEPQEGCKCGIKTDTILHEINMRQIHYRMIKVRSNPRVDNA